MASLSLARQYLGTLQAVKGYRGGSESGARVAPSSGGLFKFGLSKAKQPVKVHQGVVCPALFALAC